MDEQPYPAQNADSQGGGVKNPTSASYILAAALAGVVWTVVVFFSLLPAVDSVAYLAGVGPTGTYTATGYTTDCSYSSTGDTCWTQSEGYVEPGGAAATWPGDVQAGSSFPVRLPVLTWGPSPPLLNTGLAVYFGLISALVQLLCWGGLGYAVCRRIKPGVFRAPWR